jgi:hypothetical protein
MTEAIVYSLFEGWNLQDVVSYQNDIMFAAEWGVAGPGKIVRQPMQELLEFYFDHEAFLITGFVRLLVFVLLEMAFFAVIFVVRVVVLTFTDTLLVLLGLRIILGLVVERSGGYANCERSG